MLLSAGLHFFVLLKNYLKSPLGFEMVERKWGGARGLARCFDALLFNFRVSPSLPKPPLSRCEREI